MKKLVLVLFLLLMLVLTPQVQALSSAEYLLSGDYVGSRSPLYDQFYFHLIDFEAIDGAQIGTGTKYYVDSSISGATAGTSWATAMDTLQEAIDLCADNAGDYIYVAQAHEEEVTGAATLLFDCPGITVYGFGSGDEMPEFSLTAQASTVSVTAPDVTIFNLRFLGDWAGGSTLGIDVQATGDGFRMLGCELRSNSNNEELLIALNVTAAADRLVIAGNSFVFETGGGESSAIVFEGASNKSIVAGNRFDGDFSDYVILGTAASSVQMMIRDNTIHNLDGGASGKLISFNTATTGDIIHNIGYGVGSAQAIVADAMFVSPDNVMMTTENVETRTYESMLGAFVGDGGTDQGDSIYADVVLQKAETVLILEDTGTTIPDKIDVTDAAIAGLSTAIASIDATGFAASCTSNPANTSKATSTTLAGFGNDYFNTGWSLKCMLDFDGAGSAPEGEVIDIIDYDSATGEFTLNFAFTSQLTTGDGIWVFRQDELNLEDATILGSSATIRYVSSITGAIGDGSGLTMENAYATIALAEAACADGDVVYVGAGHDEEIGDIVINEADNISFIGLGEGDARPLLTCNDNTDEITIDKAGITMKNFRLQAGADQVVTAFRIEDAGLGCTLENISFIKGEGSNEEFVICIDVDAAAFQLTVKDCTYNNTAATTTHASTFIDLTDGTIDGTTITGCNVFGEFANGGIYSNAVCTNLSIIDNVISNTTAAKYAIRLTGAATGVLTDNRLYSNDYATMLDPGSLKCSGNIGVDAIDQQGIAMPLSATTDDVTGVADGSDLERLEYLQQLTNDALAFYGVGTGNVFYVDSAASGTTGIDWANAVNDLEEVQALLAANSGDVVFLAPGHAETMGGAGAIDLVVAGVTYIGLGTGLDMPAFTYDTDVDTMIIGAAGDGTRIINFKFISSVTAVAFALVVEDVCTDFIIEDCVFENVATGTDEFVDAIKIHGSASDRGIIRGCRFLGDFGANSGPKSSINFEDAHYLQIYDCEFAGDIGDAHIFNETAASNFVTIRDNRIMCGYIGDAASVLDTTPGISLFATTTGWIEDNFIVTNVATPDLAIVAADCYLKGNTYNELQGAAFAASPIGLSAGTEYSVTMNMAVADDDNLFAVAGGPIMITSLSFYCTTDVDGAQVWTIFLDHTDKDVEFTSAVDIVAANDGDRIVFSAANPAVPTILALTNEVGSGNPMYPWFCPVGMIEVNNDNSQQAGVFDVYMTFIPLTDGVTVTAQ